MSVHSTPSIPKSKGVFSIYARTDIHAAAAMVFAALCDFHAYRQWNTFSPNVVIMHDKDIASLAPGDEIELDAYIRGTFSCTSGSGC